MLPTSRAKCLPDPQQQQQQEGEKKYDFLVWRTSGAMKNLWKRTHCEYAVMGKKNVLGREIKELRKKALHMAAIRRVRVSCQSSGLPSNTTSVTFFPAKDTDGLSE